MKDLEKVLRRLANGGDTYDGEVERMACEALLEIIERLKRIEGRQSRPAGDPSDQT